MPSVLIIGSGLVGAATALALHQVGIKSTLYDQINPMEVVMRGEEIEFGETGGSVMIQAGGLRILETLGLLDICLKNGAILPYVSWHNIDGSKPIVADTRIANKTAGESDPRLQAPLHILRSTLHTILMQACHKKGIKTLVGKKLVGICDWADGMHSATRRKVFGEHLTANFTNSTGYIGVVRTTENGINFKETEECAFYVEREKKLGVAVFKVSDEIAAIQVSTFGDKEEQDQSTSYRPYSDLPKHAGRLADLLKSWGVPPHVEKMMRCAFRVSAASIYDLPDMDKYHKGRVVLIGDAAHGMVPNAGLGLLTGLEDVGTLLALLKSLPNDSMWEKTLELYSKIRVAREQRLRVKLGQPVSRLWLHPQFLEEAYITLYSV
ncbi:FAD/NAD(P)-binding domain-containing protein [Rhizoclosmatium globosum]|uniref:FAD/NAD(P)-binding domain-containing protein n=1 Tax=Rhizoclosmatium globosum TaxID=329046 RepID=A0A1Y2BU24_9FUNG|nr:FAD/NAD(P)-binding domain-containing protein [Rhizoclosmatium globosum]|eukprot:ORY38251.1 FAD/NAD(P)-binding domain-containing protein [Rhizoclosmatium globosum]